MSKPLDVFCEVPCLTEQSRQLSGIALQKKWFKSAGALARPNFLHRNFGVEAVGVLILQVVQCAIALA